MHSLAMGLGQRALVLKEFTINNDGPEYVHIVARKSGLISWLLTLLGIDTTTIFRVFADRIEFEQGSLSGRLHTVMPLRAISIATCGYTKPFLLVVFAIAAVFVGIISAVSMHSPGPFFVWLIVALIALVVYYLNKALVVAVVSHSSWPASVCFKRSIIEGVGVGYEQAQEVIRIINKLTMEQASK